MATIKLPSYQPPVEQARRPTATSINRSQPREQNLTVSGYNEVVPLVYGVDKVSGPMIAGPVSRGGWAYWGVAISHGPIDGYDKVVIGTDEHEVTATAQTITGDGFTYHLTFYDGAQTSVDSNLAEGIEFFGDVFNGVAYVSVKAQGENMSMTNGLVFKIRGKKVLDPRDNTLKFTENPALHLNDFITNGYYGLGREAIGVDALADHCDSSFGGAPRCRTSTVMQSGLSEESAIDLLATYAEALWAYQGGSVYLVPDAAVAQEDIIDIPMQQIFGGSVQLMTELAQDIPSSVTLTYNSDASDGLAGEPVFVSKEEATASTPYLNSSLTLMGVYRRAEAQRRAEQRLARLQIGGRVSFQMFDTGSLLKIGDVIRFPDRYGIGGMLLRVMASPELVSLGVYQIRTEVYDESIYSPSEGVGAVVLPKGAVVLWLGGSGIPNGFSRLPVSEDCLLLGGGLEESGSYEDLHAPAAPINVRAQIGTSGEHEASLFNRELTPSSLGYIAVPDFKSGSLADGAHNHGGEFNKNIEKSQIPSFIDDSFLSPLILCERESAPVNRIGFFHKEKIASPSHQYLSGVSGYIGVKESGASSQVSGLKEIILSTDQDGVHTHGNEAVMVPGSPVGGGYLSKVVPVGGHVHDVMVHISQKIRHVFMNVISCSVNGSSIPYGGVVGFIGDEIPAGWVLCNGENGSLNLIDSFINADGSEYSGNNEISLTVDGSEPSGAHTHIPTGDINWAGVVKKGYGVFTANHPPEDGLHTHEINYEKTIPFTPRHIKLAFIQYVGE